MTTRSLISVRHSFDISIRVNMKCSVVLTLILYSLTFVRGAEVTDKGKSNYSHWVYTVVDKHVDVLSNHCQQTQGPIHVSLIKNKSDEVKVCIERELALGNFIRLFSTQSNEADPADDTELFCSRLLENYEKCWNPFVSALKGCTTIKSDRDLDDVTSILYTGVHLACSEQGKRIKELRAGNSIECIEEYADKLQNCSRGPLEELLSRVVENYSMFSEDGCRIQRDSYDCISQTLSLCSEPYASDFWNELVSSTMKKTRCASISSGAAYRSTWPWPYLASLAWILSITFR